MGQQIRISDPFAKFVSTKVQGTETLGETIERLLFEAGAYTPEPIPLKGPARRRAIYQPAILKVLLALGGRAETRELKPRILSEVGPQLDRTELEVWKGNRPGWWYDTEYERWEMMPRLIRQDSAYGVWELTEDGRQEADRLKLG